MPLQKPLRLLQNGQVKAIAVELWDPRRRDHDALGVAVLDDIES